MGIDEMKKQLIEFYRKLNSLNESDRKNFLEGIDATVVDSLNRRCKEWEEGKNRKATEEENLKD